MDERQFSLHRSIDSKFDGFDGFENSIDSKFDGFFTKYSSVLSARNEHKKPLMWLCHSEGIRPYRKVNGSF